jgi:GT2 family glycosyltransferase
MPANIDYSVVILNYNGESILEKCIEHTLKAMNSCSAYKGELIVVDNDSKDRSRAILESYKNQLIPLLLDKNIILQGYNKAAEIANGEYLVLLNNDQFLDYDFFNHVIEPFESSETLFQVCNQNLNENTRTYQSGQGFGELKKGQVWLNFNHQDITKSKPVFTGGLGVYRKSIFLKLGGFCRLFHPFYWEDADLAYNAQKQGYQVIYIPEAKAEHRHQATIGSFDKKQVRYINRRNKILFFWLNITSISYWIHHALKYPLFALSWTIHHKEMDYLKIPFSLLFKLHRILPEKIARYRATKICDTHIQTLNDCR